MGGGEFKSVELDPLTIWKIFYYYFFRNFLHGDTDEKVDLGNKELPNTYFVLYLLLYITCYFLFVAEISGEARAKPSTRTESKS